jgi:hypothetical protein
MRTTPKVYHRKHEKELPTPRLTKKKDRSRKNSENITANPTIEK